MKKMYLVAIRGKQTQIVKEGIITIIQSEKKKLEKLPQWKGYIFQVRNVDAYKNWPIYDPKHKLNKK